MSAFPRTDAVVGKPRPTILALCCELERELQDVRAYAVSTHDLLREVLVQSREHIPMHLVREIDAALAKNPAQSNGGDVEGRIVATAAETARSLGSTAEDHSPSPAPTPSRHQSGRKSKVVWVIEKGSPAQYFVRFDHGAGEWTSDFFKALHFVSRDQAQKLWDCDNPIFTIYNDDCRIVDHAICGDPVPEREIPLAGSVGLTIKLPHHESGTLWKDGKLHRALSVIEDEIARSAIAWRECVHQVNRDVRGPDGWIDDAIRDLCEIPDRDSPPDFPEAMLVTCDEVREAIKRYAPTLEFVACTKQEKP